MADSTNVPDLRENYDRLKADFEKSQKDAAELRTENRMFKAQAFGLTEAQAKVFVTAHTEDVTEESVKSFATNIGLTITGQPAPKPDESKGTPAPGGESSAPSTSNPGLALMGGAGSKPGDGGQPPTGTERLTTAQLTELQKKDPLAAEKARREGRVQFSDENFYVTSGLIRNS